MNIPLILTASGFVLLTAVFFWFLLRLLKTALERSSWEEVKKKTLYRRVVVAFVGWAVFLTVWGLSGIAAKFELFPLNVAPILAVPFIAIAVVTFSGKMKHLLSLVDQRSIVHLQVFRVFVEILLWALFIQNLLPVQMTFEGRNFDIISGLTAPAAAIFLVRSRIALALWNLVCLGLLINIVTIAILSMPVPFRVFMNEPSNTIVTAFPFILLPGMLVPLAYGLSFLSLRKIFIFQNETTHSRPAPAGFVHSNQGN
ncbi:MAG TPA: hypothetical protein VFE50_21450 [Cyclobacteriaceae bacterium]|nr:hypothetical protein [Cyclobacteriaceae bacterium]